MNKPNMTPEEAIYDARERIMRLETVLTGVPNTSDNGLVGTVKENCDNLDATRKKVGRLEVRFTLLVGLLIGSGLIGGFGIAELIG
jgi:hypothetical protein